MVSSLLLRTFPTSCSYHYFITGAKLHLEKKNPEPVTWHVHANTHLHTCICMWMQKH